tara:strand:+ start:238 stop:543 length:306 start_codon:yes stop_codon:yes gene_type:complete
MTMISKSKIENFLQKSIDWKYLENSIIKDFQFKSYMESIEFINILAKQAELKNHHPDMSVGWCKINVAFTSHDKGGVTKQCLEMAEFADLIYEKLKFTNTN